MGRLGGFEILKGSEGGVKAHKSVISLIMSKGGTVVYQRDN